jgi:mRNA-degrading endonuclease toxin of MazEF toxin-antitoxin module
LARDSVVNASQMVTLDKSDFRKRLGILDGLKMEQVEAA